MRLLGASGVWEIFVPGVGEGAHYKFEIRDRARSIKLKTDPYGFFFETAAEKCRHRVGHTEFRLDGRGLVEAAGGGAIPCVPR